MPSLKSSSRATSSRPPSGMAWAPFWITFSAACFSRSASTLAISGSSGMRLVELDLPRSELVGSQRQHVADHQAQDPARAVAAPRAARSPPASAPRGPAAESPRRSPPGASSPGPRAAPNFDFSSSRCTTMALMGFFTSWPTPEVSRPMAAMRRESSSSDSIFSADSRSCSVTSAPSPRWVSSS